MDEIITQIIARLRAGEMVDERTLVKLIHAAAKRAGADKRTLAKRRLLPYYQRVKAEDPARWAAWGITPALERRLVETLRMKPRRSASGVATITVITKPWPCSGHCIFCPNDIRCPKSYLSDEPACARAVQNCFDPYLQVVTRLTALAQMGHATDKIELIVLGGTWSDYPLDYQVWFMRELFRALNDDARAGEGATPAVEARRARYRAHGVTDETRSATREAALDELQHALEARRLTYNEACAQAYGQDGAWRALAAEQHATFDELEAEQRRNEGARHRVVGLVVETRPDAITPARLLQIRRMGATKIQMGVQSLDQRVLDMNHRGTTVAQIARAFGLLRLFGFKTHAHAMVNLLGATPASDVRDYARLVGERDFLPDEIKLYPCALIEGAALNAHYEDGTWRPYTEDELVDVLCADVRATPAFCRVSRMIRDFSTGDIKAGNKKPNLRQLVEERLRAEDAAGAMPVREIRFREVATDRVALDELSLEVLPYETSCTSERFLQWVTPEGRIAGFLRLSLPQAGAQRALAAELAAERLDAPMALGEAMIREVHVYGVAERMGEAGGGAAQHHGLGRRLIARACTLAAEAGYTHVNVISAVGTRAYYRRLGFEDHGLYQRKELS